MSRKVKITRIELSGAPVFLRMGVCGFPYYSSDGEEIARWLCGAFRFRFNQCRSNRSRWVEDAVGELLEPIGVPDRRSIKETRWDEDWIRGVPERLLHTAERVEPREWFAAAARRKTLIEQGLDPGRMPGFKDRKHGLQFEWHYNKGRGFTFIEYSRRHGEIILGGRNPKGCRDHGVKWRLHIHVRLTGRRGRMPEFTSIHVDLDGRTVSFTYPPRPREHRFDGNEIGLDAGVKHDHATSTGVFLDWPKSMRDRIHGIDRQIEELQRRQASIVNANANGDFKLYKRRGASNRYIKLAKRIKALSARRRRIIEDWQHKTTSKLVDGNDFIAVEKLNIKGMVRKPKPKPDPDRPGAYLPNNHAAKSALANGILDEAWGRFHAMLEYKAKAAGIIYMEDPAYTSQRCHVCGHVAKGNRESQAVFHCHACGWTGNADINAAINILHDGLEAYGKSPSRAGHVRNGSTRSAARKTRATRSTRESQDRRKARTVKGIPGL